MRLPAAVYGEPGAETALVLLHQTNLDGLCGWDAFGRDAAERGFAAVSFDMCGWGASECPEEWSERTSEQVAAAVDLARTDLDADRVVLVGASMGAARTVFAMADGVDADAWVSLSGRTGVGRPGDRRRGRGDRRSRDGACTTPTTATPSSRPPG